MLFLHGFMIIHNYGKLGVDEQQGPLQSVSHSHVAIFPPKPFWPLFLHGLRPSYSSPHYVFRGREMVLGQLLASLQ